MLPDEQINKLINEGITDLIKGFTNKSGKKFDAYIVLNEDKKGTNFKFPERR